MKTLEFFYQETEIHFLVNPQQKNVMVNATEMAKIFGKRTDHFMKSDHAKKFISLLENETEQTPNGGRSKSKSPDISGNLNGEFPPNGRNSEFKIVDNRGHMGIYFERRLALKFAAWLSPEFEVWVFSTLDEILFGHYRKHWDAHARQEEARLNMEFLKEKLIREATPEMAVEYFEAEREFNSAKYDKTKAIKNQLRLFDEILNKN